MAGPVALGGVGVVVGAVSEDPAVHDEPGDHAELDGLRVVPLSAYAAEVLYCFGSRSRPWRSASLIAGEKS